MSLALDQANQAAEMGEVPVGAVVVHQGKVIAAAHNQPIALQDPSAHAEILAMRQAGQVLSNYRLVDCTLYVTLEPCLMCVGAMVHARIARCVFAASDPKSGALISVVSGLEVPGLNHQFVWESGVLSEPCSEVLKTFFRARRQNARS